MRVLIIGAGWVGITMSVLLSTSHDVTLIDVDEQKIEKLRLGESHIDEPGIGTELQDAVESGRILVIGANQVMRPQDVVMVCVGTPETCDGQVDLKYIETAINSIFDRIDEICENYVVIVIKSTVPPGTTRKYLIEPLLEREELKGKVGMVFNPEFLREGSALNDARNPDRIIIGSSDKRATEQVQKMYDQCLGERETIYLEMSPESAELCKYANNTFLAMKISFANEIADVAESIENADISDVMTGVGADHRIASSFFGAGAGYGGSCFPKDIQGLAQFAEQQLIEMPLLRATQLVNSRRPQKLVDMLIDEIGNLHDKKVAVLGLAFKPNTNDTRESPTLKIIDILFNHGSKIWIHDPLVNSMDLSAQLIQKATITEDLESCLMGASGCILVTDWPIYLESGLEKLTRLMSKKVFIDGRRVFVTHYIPSDVLYRTVGIRLNLEVEKT